MEVALAVAHYLQGVFECAVEYEREIAGYFFALVVVVFKALDEGFHSGRYGDNHLFTLSQTPDCVFCNGFGFDGK